MAIGNTTQGPYTLGELAEYYADGNIVLDTLVYRDGWPDWIHAGEISELQEAASALRERPIPNAMPASPAVTQLRAAGMGGAALERPVAMGSDPFGESLAYASSPRVSAADMLSTTTRHEGTVQFSVDQIRALSAVSAPSLVPVAPAKPGYASGEGSGLIDVASLVQAQSQSEANFRPIMGAEISPLDTMAPVSLPIAARAALDVRTKVYASLAALGLVLTGGIGVLAVTHTAAPVAAVSVGSVSVERVAAAQPPSTEPVVAEPPAANPAGEAEAPSANEAVAREAVATKEPARAAEAGRELAIGANLADSGRAPKAQRRSPKSASTKRDDGERVTKTSSEKPGNEKASSKAKLDSDIDDLLAKGPSKEKSGASKKSAGPSIDDLLTKDPPKAPKKGGSASIDDLLDGAVSAKKQAPKSEAAAEPKSDLPQTPSRDAMLAALSRAKSKVQSCKGSGVATADISIAGSGRVSSVAVSGVEGPAKSCVENAVRSTPFPKFQKETFQVKFPFKLKG